MLLVVGIAVGYITYSTYLKPNTQDSSSPVRDTTTIVLKDGESYRITAERVSKTINGITSQMLAYNGSIPGPTLKVKQGSTISLTLHNRTALDTSLHSHGVRMANKFDGVVGVTQDAIKPGESFTYTLQFPDPGVYWYHPHVREDYAQPAGLYGVILVEPTNPAYYNPVHREEIITLSDISLTDTGYAPFNESTVDHALMGKYGSTFLTNGSQEYNRTYSLGEVVRFHIVNVSSTRVYNLTIPQAQIKVVGSDGGRYEKEFLSDSVLLSPSERATIEVLFGKPGKTSLQSVSPAAAYNLATFTVQEPLNERDLNNEFGTFRTDASIRSRIDIDSKTTAKPDKTLEVALDMNMGRMDHRGHTMGMMTHPDTGEKIEWEDGMRTMNEQSTKETVRWRLIDTETRKENMDIMWHFKKGELVKLRVYNSPHSMHPMQHPIHVHGQKFLVLATNGIPSENLVWKDTALVQTGDTVDLLIEMSNPGEWMIHCHIPEHMESGMMSMFNVI